MGQLELSYKAPSRDRDLRHGRATGQEEEGQGGGSEKIPKKGGAASSQKVKKQNANPEEAAPGPKLEAKARPMGPPVEAWKPGLGKRGTMRESKKEPSSQNNQGTSDAQGLPTLASLGGGSLELGKTAPSHKRLHGGGDLWDSGLQHGREVIGRLD